MTTELRQGRRQAVATLLPLGAGAGERGGGRPWPALSRVLLAVIVCSLALAFAREMLIVWGRPDGDMLDPWNDARTYLAAGERLNAGRQLYVLGSGDRAVLLFRDYPVPILSPPPIAAIWRPLAAMPFGFILWVASAWMALLGTIVYLVIRIGLRAAVVAAALSFPVGEQLVAANLTAFFPCLLVLAWNYRHHPRAGAIIGAMAGLKLAPAVMAGWFGATQRGRGVAWMLAGGLSILAIGLVGAGLEATLDYAGLVPSIPPSPMSLSGVTGIRWLSGATMLAGTLIAAVLWRRPHLSFVVGVTTLVIASPTLFPTTFTLLLAALAPMLPTRTAGTPPPP